MPYYGLMDATNMLEAKVALKRSQLHLLGGKRRLQKGLTAAGIIALYDAVLFGMRYYIASHKQCVSFVEDTELWDAMALYHALARAGVFEDPLTFNRFNLIVERALWQGSFVSDVEPALNEAEKMLTKLGILPSNESTH
jgi:hypothetical protein